MSDSTYTVSEVQEEAADLARDLMHHAETGDTGDDLWLLLGHAYAYIRWTADEITRLRAELEERHEKGDDVEDAIFLDPYVRTAASQAEAMKELQNALNHSLSLRY